MKNLIMVISLFFATNTYANTLASKQLDVAKKLGINKVSCNLGVSNCYMQLNKLEGINVKNLRLLGVDKIIVTTSTSTRDDIFFNESNEFNDRKSKKMFIREDKISEFVELLHDKHMELALYRQVKVKAVELENKYNLTLETSAFNEEDLTKINLVLRDLEFYFSQESNKNFAKGMYVRFDDNYWDGKYAIDYQGSDRIVVHMNRANIASSLTSAILNRDLFNKMANEVLNLRVRIKDEMKVNVVREDDVELDQYLLALYSIKSAFKLGDFDTSKYNTIVVSYETPLLESNSYNRYINLNRDILTQMREF